MAKSKWLVSVVGVKSLKAKMKKRKDKLSATRRINHKAVVLIDRWIQKNFESEGKLAHPGSGWKPLKPATIAGRRRGSSRILQDTGQLKTRWKHYWDNSKAVVQSGVEYGRYHQEGNEKLPVRRIMPLEGQIFPDIKKLYRNWVNFSIK